jgi:hypothetical protein
MCLAQGFLQSRIEQNYNGSLLYLKKLCTTNSTKQFSSMKLQLTVLYASCISILIAHILA